MGYRLLIDAACICCKQFSQILRHQQYRFDASEMNRNRNFEYENFIFNETKTPGNQQYLWFALVESNRMWRVEVGRHVT